jgi:hypothetical protein
MEDLSTYDLDDLEAAVEHHGMTVVGRERWDEVCADSTSLTALRKGLQDEVERLEKRRQKSGGCGPIFDEYCDGEISALSDSITGLQALLDSSGGEK